MRPIDDFDRDAPACEVGFKFAACITAVGEDVRDERDRSPRPADQFRGAIAILHARRNDLDAEQQPYRVDDDVAFDAFDFLASVVTDRIRMAPPFSVALTAWVSMIAAVGDASRPACSRVKTSSS